MKKLTNVLLAGLTAVVMSGCNGDETATGNSVALSDLGLGYKVTGTGGLNGYELESYTFCGDIATYIYTGEDSKFNTAGPYYFVDGNVFEDDELSIQIDTEADGTPGRFEEGATYVGLNSRGDEILDYLPNHWTVTSIEEVECIPEPT